MYLVIVINFAIGFMVPVYYSILETYRKCQLKRAKRKMQKAVDENLKKAVTFKIEEMDKMKTENNNIS